MTYSEAIEIIKMAQAEIQWEYPMEYATAFDMAIQAMELQVAKKVEIETYHERMSLAEYEAYVCPICGEYSALVKDVKVSEDDQPPFCWNCGQRLDWSEE